MIYLVDTNVISELIKPTPNRRAVSWALQNKSVIVLSPIVLAEVRVGILLLPRGKRRDELMEWYVRDVQQVKTVDIDAHLLGNGLT